MMGMEEERQDLWTSRDKLYHILFCFSLTLIFSHLLSRSIHPFLGRNSIFLASSLSLFAGAAKETADHFGYFRSSGASFKDAIADVFGVFIASFLLSLSKFHYFSAKSKLPDPTTGLSLV